MFRFAQPEYLVLLMLIPLLLVVYSIYASRRKKALLQFGSMPMIKQLAPRLSTIRGWVKMALWLLAFVFFVLGLARPQLGARVKEVKKKGSEIIIALDVSNSMLAQDFSPNRLENAKRAIARLVDKLGDDRVGLIVFAGDAYIQLPVTSDYASAKLFLNAINPGIVSRQGTAIGKAITTAIRSFSLQSEKSRALIIISDGENHDDDPLAATEQAVKEGIKVYTIGIGSAQGSPIPLPDGGMMKDKDGNMVVTRLDESTLQEIAQKGNGLYVRASNANLGLNEIVSDLDKLDKQEMSSVIYEDFNEQYHWMFFAAILLLILEQVVIERKNNWTTLDFLNRQK